MDMALERLVIQKIVDPEVALEKASDREAFGRLIARLEGPERRARERGAGVGVRNPGRTWGRMPLRRESVTTRWRRGVVNTRWHRPNDPNPSDPDPTAPASMTEWRALLEGALVAVLEAADEGVFVFDRNGKCRMIGRRVADLFGIDPAKLVGKMRRGGPGHDLARLRRAARVPGRGGRRRSRSSRRRSSARSTSFTRARGRSSGRRFRSCARGRRGGGSASSAT